MASSEGAQIDNGIVVGEVKLFDHRALINMLQAAETSLTGINGFDQTSLTGGLGSIQGGQSAASNLGTQALGAPGATGTIKDTISSFGTKSATTQREITYGSPTPPTLTPPTPVFTAPSTFGVSAEDLLGEQTALTYQVINLRLLLERALSDRFALLRSRLPHTPGWVNEERPLVLIGFRISIDTPKAYRNAVAEVEVTVAEPTLDTIHMSPEAIDPPAKKGVDDGSDRAALKPKMYRPANAGPTDLSLVALYPASKTYNVATATSKTSGFGIGAIFQPFINLGVSSSQSRETLYLVRDTDTVALEKLSPECPQAAITIRFAWQFRPVLGRPVVEAGARQVFAALALPPIFFPLEMSTSPEDLPTIPITIRTVWKKYDQKTGTVGEELSQRSVEQSSVPVLSPAQRDDILQPVIESLDWVEVGNKQALVQVEGGNFANGTIVLLGGAELGTAQGFRIQDEHRLQFVVSADAIASKPLFLKGVAGRAQPIHRSEDQRPGIKIEDVHPRPGDSDFPGAKDEPEGVDRPVMVRIKRRSPTSDASAPWFPRWDDDNGSKDNRLDRHVLVSYGGQLFNLSDSPVTFTPDASGTTAELAFRAPVELVRRARSIAVLTPFVSDVFSDELLLSESKEFTATNAIVLAQDTRGTYYGIVGTNFRKGEVKVTIRNCPINGSDQGPLTVVDPTLLRLYLTPRQTKGLKNVVVQQGTASLPVALPVAEPPPSPEPNVTSVPTINVGDEDEIVLEGTHFDSVDKVTYLGDELKAHASEDGKKLTLEATKELKRMRKSAGSKRITFVLKDGQTIPFKLEVKPK